MEWQWINKTYKNKCTSSTFTFYIFQAGAKTPLAKSQPQCGCHNWLCMEDNILSESERGTEIRPRWVNNNWVYCIAKAKPLGGRKGFWESLWKRNYFKKDILISVKYYLVKAKRNYKEFFVQNPSENNFTSTLWTFYNLLFHAVSDRGLVLAFKFQKRSRCTIKMC